MKRNWQASELVEHWTLLPDELALLDHKTEQNRLGFALLLKFFQLEARFPSNSQEVPNSVVGYVASLVGVSPEKYQTYDWQGRNIKHHRAQIRNFFGFREATVTDAEELIQWLIQQVLAYDLKPEHLKTAALVRLRELKIEPPTQERLERIIRSAIRSFEDSFFANTLQQLSHSTRKRMDDLLNTTAPEIQGIQTPTDNETSSQAEPSAFSVLKTDPGRIGLDSFQKEVEKLQLLRQLELPQDLFHGISPKVLQIYRNRAAVEPPRELRRHPVPRRYTLLAIFCWLRSQEITDNLVELLISIVHRLGARAEQKVEKELLEDFKRVGGKTNLLFQMAEASLNQPDGVVRNVIFPVVGEQTLLNLVKEYKSTGNAYRSKVYTVMRASYSNHYRRMLPLLLSLLEFRSNNDVHRPVIQALDLLKKYANTTQRYYEKEEEVPLAGICQSEWQELILESNSDGELKINRINYEIGVLQALRDGLRCKEIWVVGANRYRNPEEDLPTDFEAQRQVYYQALKQPMDASEFIAAIQHQMSLALTQLDKGMPLNPAVKITNKNNGWISVSPFNPQNEPVNLSRLKREIGQRWPMTSLLDILKETDFRVNFSEHFKSVSGRESLDRSVLQKRLLLCLYGLGTNTGLKRLSTEVVGESYYDLLYVRRRFIHKQQLRNAIASVVNAQHKTRTKWTSPIQHTCC